MAEQIVRRKAALKEPNQPDDVLGRLLSLQDEEHPWLDDDAVRRGLGGLIVGAVDTTSKFVTLGIDELLRRPAQWNGARQSAWQATRTRYGGTWLRLGASTRTLRPFFVIAPGQRN
jgi:cytochrome P450